MDTDNNTIDEMLQEFGIGVSPINDPQTSEEVTDGSSIFSDEDLNNILEENGFGSESSEEDDYESYNENQGEGGDLNAEIQAREEENHVGEIMDVEFVENEENTQSNIEENNDIQEIAKIPLNSPTLLIDESTSRFSGAEWFNEIQKQRIIIAGIGGIGSNLVFQIARMIPANITIYDDDIVENVNMAGQLYSCRDVGRAKVNAIANMVQSYTTMRQINAIKDKFADNTEAGDIMMCGFDNMRARKTFFNSWVNHVLEKPDAEKKKCLFLDGRLSMTTLQILCIRGDDWHDIDRYRREFLFKDSEADETVCSMKQTTYLACMIGSLMTNLFTNFVANLLDPIIPYDLPFFTEYDAQTMIFKTEN